VPAGRAMTRRIVVLCLLLPLRRRYIPCPPRLSVTALLPLLFASVPFDSFSGLGEACSATCDATGLNNVIDEGGRV
jgi:hypothetical protein